MKKTILILLAALAFAVRGSAQQGIWTVSLGYAPMGNSTIHIRCNDEDYVSKQYHLHYQKQKGYYLTLQLPAMIGFNQIGAVDFSYSKYQLGKVEKEDDAKLHLAPSKFEDISVYSFYIMSSLTLWSSNTRRFNLPMYFGVGADYVSGAPFKHLFPAVANKTRLTIWLANRFTMYAGVNAKLGMSLGKTELSNESGHSLTFFKLDLSPEIGLQIDLSFGKSEDEENQYDE